MSKIIRIAIGCVFFLFIILRLFAGYAGASNHDGERAQPSAWDNKIPGLNQTLKELQSEKERLSREGDQLAEKIKQEKQKSQSIGNRKLESMLRESQQLVSDLESVSRQIKEIEGALTQEYSAAITALVNQLEKEPQEKKKKILLKQLLEYIEIYEGLMEPAQLQIPTVSMEIQAYDTPYDIRKKADFLADQTALMKAKMLQIDAQIDKLEKEKALRDKVKRFADEINFFDSTLFVEDRRVAQKGADSQENGSQIPNDDEVTGPDGDNGPLLGDGIGQETAPPSISVQGAAPESSPSDLVLSSGGIDNRIGLLRQQKIQLEDLIRQLWQKMQNFYKRAEEEGSSQSQ